jgi:hypothetical protein
MCTTKAGKTVLGLSDPQTIIIDGLLKLAKVISIHNPNIYKEHMLQINVMQSSGGNCLQNSVCLSASLSLQMSSIRLVWFGSFWLGWIGGVSSSDVLFGGKRKSIRKIQMLSVDLITASSIY